MGSGECKCKWVCEWGCKCLRGSVGVFQGLILILVKSEVIKNDKSKNDKSKNDKSKNEGLDLFGSGCEKMKSRS